MKKILASIMTIALVATSVVSATRAAFTDSEEVLGNTFAAGSLDLELGSLVSLPFSVSNIQPGDSGEGQVTLTNTGSLPGNLDVDITNLVQAENGVLEPETEAGDPGDAGDLGLALRMAMFLDMNTNGVYDGGDIELEYSGNTNTTAGLQFAKVTDFVGKDWADDLVSDLPSGLTAGSSVDLVIQWQFPHDAYVKPDAIYMTDSLGFDVEMSLVQLP